jgi:nucleoredoxin
MSCSHMRMRQLLLVLLVTGTALSAALGRSLPLTTKEVTLMLRSGYSSEAVQRELSIRRLAESCDAAGEKALTDAGASPALIDAIKSGSYQSSPADAQAALEQLAAQTERRVLETERLRKMELLPKNQLVRATPPATSNGETSSALVDLLRGDLVSWRNGSLVRFDDEPLGKKKLIALYFSAHWCGPCRKFTPKLVEFYNQVAPQHPEFEIVFVSSDRSPFGMETYMRDTQMPWPAIDFAKLPGKEALKKFAGESIPCLVLLDATGRVISDTYVDKKFVGPEKVLADLNAIFAKAPTAIAVTK